MSASEVLQGARVSGCREHRCLSLKRCREHRCLSLKRWRCLSLKRWREDGCLSLKRWREHECLSLKRWREHRCLNLKRWRCLSLKRWREHRCLSLRRNSVGWSRASGCRYSVTIHTFFKVLAYTAPFPASLFKVLQFIVHPTQWRIQQIGKGRFKFLTRRLLLETGLQCFESSPLSQNAAD